MALHEQKLTARYIDKEKLDRLWQTNDDFKGKGCSIVGVSGCFYSFCPFTGGLTRRGHHPVDARRYRTPS